jgi:4-amino-4-deoxy-L-arabinose transferase-like glycosyltransferase
VISTCYNNALVEKRTWVRDIVSIVVCLGIFYALWIGSHALISPDEGRYSEVAREMVASGDYVTPRLNGVAFLDKPALYYWLQASAIQVFGLKEWALRLWPATLGIICTLMTYIAGRLIFTRRTGIISAIILATSPLYYGGSHYANLDLEVASLVSDSLLCFIAAMQVTGSRLKNGLLMAAYVFAGLAALTKGLIGIVFPAMIIGAWIVILNRWNILTKMRLFTGAIIFFSITAPWYFLVQKANPEFLHYFFVTQQVSRFLTTQEFNSKAAVWFYIPIVLLGFFPWSVFLFQAAIRNIKLIWQNRQQHAAELFLLLWLVIIFTFFSVPLSKTVGYILPIFPACALIVGNYLNTFWDSAKAKGINTGIIIYAIMACLLSAFIFAAPLWSDKLETPVGFLPYLQGMAVILLITLFGCLSFLRRKNLLPLFSTFTVSVIAMLLIFINSTPTINEKSIKPLAMELKSQLNSNDEVVVFYKYYHDLPIYLERRITIVADWHSPDIARNDNWLREMWYGMVFQNTKDWLIEEDTFWSRWNSDKHLYVVTDADGYKNIQAKGNVYVISHYNDTLLLSNQAAARSGYAKNSRQFI